MALLLLLDTSGPLSTAALARDGVVVAVQTHAGSTEGAAVLNGLVAGALAAAGADFAALDGVAVLAGPGSYTGLRVAVAAAKGFCYALNQPLIGTNKLELLAIQAAAGHPDATVVAALPARAGEWFVAAYAADGTALLPPAHRLEGDVQAWMEAAPKPLCWTGSPLLSPFSTQFMSTNAEGALQVPVWAATCEAAWQAGRFEPLGSFSPFYLKAPFIAEKKNA